MSSVTSLKLEILPRLYKKTDKPSQTQEQNIEIMTLRLKIFKIIILSIEKEFKIIKSVIRYFLFILFKPVQQNNTNNINKFFTTKCCGWGQRVDLIVFLFCWRNLAVGLKGLDIPARVLWQAFKLDRDAVQLIPTTRTLALQRGVV